MIIRHIYISKDHNFFGHHGQAAGTEPVVEVEEAECVAGSGLRGDRFFDFKPDYKGQVTFFSYEQYERLCDQFDVRDKSPGAFRRNIVVSGVNLNDLIDETFEVQGIKFFGTQEAAPCYWMEEAFHEGAEFALKGNGGLRAKILTDGILKVDS